MLHIRNMFVCVVSVMAFLIPYPQIYAQEVLFSENFETGREKQLFKKWAGGAVKNENIEIVSSDAFSGEKCLKLTFTPKDGTYWYYRLRTDVIQEAEPDYVTAAALKYKTASGGTIVELCTTSASYKDEKHKEIKVDGYMEALARVSKKDTWEEHKSMPYNKIKLFKAQGKDEPYVKFLGIVIAVRSSSIGVPVTIWIDNISIGKAGAVEAADAYNDLRKKHPCTPKDYPVQKDHFYYGMWSHGLATGFDPFKGIMSKKERYLYTIEKMLECNFDTMFSESYNFQDITLIDEIIESTEIAYKYGLSTIAKTYLTPYYNKSKTIAECQTYVDTIIPKLKTTKGVVAYYHIDEPNTDEKTLEYWIWGKNAINAIDPDKPVTGAFENVSKIKYYSYTQNLCAMDIYPLLTEGKTYQAEGGSVHMIESFCAAAYQAGAKDIWIMNQAFFQAWPGFRMPTAAELRMMSYMSLAFGSKGLFYFAFVAPVATDTKAIEKVIPVYNGVYAAQYDFGKEVIRLGNILPIYAPVIVGTSWQKNVNLALDAGTLETPSENKKTIGYGYNAGKNYDVLVCYNRSGKSAQKGKIQIPDELLKGRKVFDLIAGKEIKLAGSYLPLSFDAGDGTIFVIANDKDFAGVANACNTRRYNATKRRFDFYATEAQNAKINIADELKSVQQSAELLKTDSLVASVRIDDAYNSLGEKMESCSAYSSVKKHMKNIQDNYSAILNLYWPYMADNYKTISISDDKKWSLWTTQMITFSEIYVLTRNGLYAGKLNEALSIAKDTNALLTTMEQATGPAFTPVSVDDAKLSAVFNQAKKNFSGIALSLVK